jgi:hypothetical protein
MRYKTGLPVGVDWFFWICGLPSHQDAAYPGWQCTKIMQYPQNIQFTLKKTGGDGKACSDIVTFQWMPRPVRAYFDSDYRKKP